MDSINVAFVGTISAGKTTLLNALFKQNLGDTHIIKTTILPHIYCETDTNQDTLEYIQNNTFAKNKQFRDNKVNDIDELRYNVSKLTDFISFNKNISLNLYDIPGLNDSETKELYYRYLERVFRNINIVIWSIDVNSAINTSDELDICQFLLKNMKNNNTKHNIDTKLVVLLNKCDNMYINDGEFILEPEVQDMYNQAKRMIDTNIRDIYPQCRYNIVPISSENSYIYRMIQKEDIKNLDEKYLNKLGYREFARKDWNRMTTEQKINNLQQKLNSEIIENELENTGFNKFIHILQSYFNDNGEYLFLLDGIKSKMLNDLDKATKYDIITIFKNHKLYIDKLLSEVKFDSIYIDNVMDVFNKCIIEILYIYDETIKKAIQYNNVKSIETCKTSKEFYDELLKFVESDIIKNNSCYTKVLAILTDDIIKKIHETKDIDFDTQFEYINTLMTYGYDKWVDILTECFTENDIINSDTKLFIETIRSCYTTLKFKPEILINISLTIMDKQYCRYFEDGNITTIMSCAKYWDDIIMRTNNPYSFPIFRMRQMLNRYIGMKLSSVTQFNTDCDFMIENFILGLFKKVYPDDIISKDSLL